jgi:hypothetical protein
MLVLAIGFAITSTVSAGQFPVDLWGITYIADRDDVAESAFKLDDVGCRKEVTALVYEDASKGVDNKAAWTKTYLGCMEAKGYKMTLKKPE